MIKRIFGLLIILFLSLVLLFIVGSSGSTDPENHNVVKSYSSSGKKVKRDTFSIMTYNIGYLSGMTNNLPVARSGELFVRNLALARSLIHDLSPDIIGFQEIDFGSSRSYHMQQLDSIAMYSGYGFSYQSINWDKRYVPFPYWPPSRNFGKVLSGQAILSRYPIGEDTTIVLGKPVNSSFVYNAFYLDRLLQVCTIRLDEQDVKVMNVHLEAFDEETRIIQAKVVRDLYETYAAVMPVVLIGDFNSRPVVETDMNGAMKVMSVAKNLSSAITDEMYITKPSEYFTFNSEAPDQMIDYILYTPESIEKIAAGVVEEANGISDHLPLLMKFRLKQ